MWLISTTTEGERSVVIGEGEAVIGRQDECAVVLDDPKVSRHHAAARLQPDGRVEIRDLGSSNGTWVGDQRISAPVLLGDGDTFRVGQTVLRLSAADPDGVTTIDRPPAAAGAAGAAAAPAAAAAGAAAGGAAAPQAAGAQPAGSPGFSAAPRSQSAIERLKLGKAVKTATIVGGAAILLGAAAIALLLVFVVFKDEDKPLTTAEIVEKVAPSTVLVVADVDGERAGNGTGWVLDAKEGLIVTNAHVVNGGETFQIGVDGRNRPAKVVASAPCEDLAVLKVDDTSGLKTLPLASQDSLKRGDRSIAVGFPGTASKNDDLTATQGVISRTKTTFDLRAPDVPDYRNVILTDTAINPGNSGGPLVNDSGKLIGVNSAAESTKENQAYAIGVDRVKEITAKLRTGQSLGWTGMDLEYPDADALQNAGLPLGLLVEHAVEGTPAATAGIGQDPLILTAVNGTPVENNLPSYCEAIKGIAPGQTATFTFATSPTQTIDVPMKFA